MTRRCLALSALGTLCLFAPARSPANEKTTGAPVEQTWSWDIALTRASEPGPPFMLEGTVVGLPDSLPIHGATIYFYHADTRGRYSPGGESKPRLAGTLHTNIVGGFRVRTVLPGTYDGSPHMHYTVSGPGFDRRVGTLSLARLQGAGSDSAYARIPWMLKLPAESWAYVNPAAAGGYRCEWRLFVHRTGGDASPTIINPGR